MDTRRRTKVVRAAFGARIVHGPQEGGFSMLGWAVTFFVIAIFAGVLGFTGIAGAAAGIAKILFVVFLIVFIVSLFMGRRRPTL